MIANSGSALVPDNESLARFVEQQWTRLHRAIYDDMPYESIVRSIDEAISIREKAIAANALKPNFEWQQDLDLGKLYHRSNLTWIDHHRAIRARYLDYWKSVTEKNSAYLRELALNGMKSMLLIHGGVAVGALGVLTQKTGGSQVLLTAKFALGFALIGMILLGFGQLVMVNRMMSLNSRLEGKLANKLKWKKLAAFPRYFNRHKWPLKYTDWMIYGSIFWFGIYSAILYTMFGVLLGGDRGALYLCFQTFHERASPQARPTLPPGAMRWANFVVT